MANDIAPRKNIVFIMADQLAACHLHCYGSGVDSTPGLDRLAARGTRFDRCYATAPLCGPNRATFLTGRSPCVHGIVDNNFALANDMPTYAHVLRAAGYRTGGFGKFHQTPMHFPTPRQVDFLGFDESAVTEDPKWPWYEWVKQNHPQHAADALAKAWAQWPGYPPHLDLPLKKTLPAAPRNSPWPPMHPSNLPPEVHDSTYITNLGIDFIDRHHRDHPDRPFFCHISYVDPHDPYDPPEPYASMFNPNDMPDPLPAEWLNDDFPSLRKSQNFIGFQRVWDKPEIMRQLRALYHGSLRYLDDQIQRVIHFLDARGLTENTLVIFTTDHGEMLGDHGLITKGCKHYDAGIRCPLIVAGPRIPVGVNAGLACTLDFFPTFCDWAGAAENLRPPLEGRSFADPLKADRWEAVSVAIRETQSVITRDHWRLTRYVEDQKGQMFNLTSDPREQHNLYDDPRFADRRAALLEQMVAVMNHAARSPHYRNMPLLDERKVEFAENAIVRSARHYQPPLSPALNGQLGHMARAENPLP